MFVQPHPELDRQNALAEPYEFCYRIARLSTDSSSWAVYIFTRKRGLNAVQFLAHSMRQKPQGVGHLRQHETLRLAI